jgi:hypothetical protein
LISEFQQPLFDDVVRPIREVRLDVLEQDHLRRTLSEDREAAEGFEMATDEIGAGRPNYRLIFRAALAASLSILTLNNSGFACSSLWSVP